MKILWYTDTHFGLSGAFSRPSSSGYTTRLDETLELHQWITKKVKEYDPDLVVNGGDIFKPQVVMHGMEVSAASRGTARVVKASKMHLTLLGNHDYISRDTKVTSIDWLDELPNSKVIRQIDFMEADDGKSLIIFCPYLWEYSWAIKKIETIIEDAGGLDTYDNLYFFGHAEVGGALNTVSVDLGSGEEKEHYSNNQNSIPPEWLSNLFHYAFNGHHHIPQEPEPNVFLSGSAQQFTVTEYATEEMARGIYILDTESKDLEFIENKISPKIVRVENNLDKLEEIDSNSYVMFYYKPKEFDKEELIPNFKRFKGFQLKQISPDKFRPITSVDFKSKDEDNTGIYKEYLGTVAFEDENLEKQVEKKGLEIIKEAEDNI